MMRNDSTEKQLTSLVAFAGAAALTFGAMKLTLVPGLGPGSAAAWAAASLGAGQPADAGWAPLFRLLVRLAGLLGPAADAAYRANLLTAIGLAIGAGFFAGGLNVLFRHWNIWGATAFAAFGGTVVALARVSWASGLLVNPAPWAAAAVIGAWFFATRSLAHDLEIEARQRSVVLAAQLTGLSLSLHLVALIALPATLYLVVRAAVRTRVRWTSVLLGFLLPLLLFILHGYRPTFDLVGFYWAPQGIPENLIGLSLVGWSALHALTPFALIPAIWGGIALVRRLRGSLLPLLLLAGGLVLGGLLGQTFSEFSSLLTGMTVIGLAVIGVADLLSFLPGGLSILLWLLVPVIWATQGPIVSRTTETVWAVNARNVLRTTRYQSRVLSTDATLINAPYAYLRAAEKLRPDLIVFNPTRLDSRPYIDWLADYYPTGFTKEQAAFDSLKHAVDNGAPRDSLTAMAKRFVETFSNAETNTAKDGSGGLLVTPGFDPGTQHHLVPEGLLMRVAEYGKKYPFLFRSLDMGPIHFRKRATTLEHQLVFQYAEMFTLRGSWMLNHKYTAEGMDYIRWALKVDPAYTPARILADEYAIYGEPRKLGS